jgi:hypothetical protein
MFSLQDFLNRSGYAWFHLYELEVIARSRTDPPMDVLFEAVVDLNAQLRLLVNLVGGSQEEFGILVTSVAEMVPTIIDD